MTTKLLVTTRSSSDVAQVDASGADILAEYPDGLLVRATDAQAAELTAAGLETTEMSSPPIQTASARFTFADAVAADAAAPIDGDPHRVAYYVVQLVGPTKNEWLDAITARGGTLQGSLSGYRLLVGITPTGAATIAGEAFVDGITPYRPAMKVSPALRRDVPGRDLGVHALSTVDDIGATPAAGAVQDDVQVQITVFPGESTEDVAAEIRAAGGIVLSHNERTVIGIAPPPALERIASREGIEAILPHAFPEPTNDRAATLMHVPANHVFGTFHLTGAGQVVGITDSGLDTGNAATVHADLLGRVTIVSSPNQFGGSSTDPPPFDDGAADELGHGTHVAGSVAGNGAAAVAAGSATIPTGVAPGASVHFTAIGQRVNWAPGVNAPAFGLYGIPANLNNLFTPAYTAGARIHTNSWGSRNTAANPNVEGSYDAQANQVDTYSVNHRDALVLFSAGNNGRDANADVQIDADSIGTPGTAKNCLTVGASENNRPAGSAPTPGVNTNWTAAFGPRFAAFAAAGHVSDNGQGMALFSSRGPTDDGRRKPDVVAPGTNVLSVRSTAFSNAVIGAPAAAPILWGDVAAPDPLAGLYCWSGGTSMSTPLVAGAAALVRQHLVDQRGHHQDGVTPSGALIKAILVNGATPIAGQFPGEVPADPNTVDGFGLVDLTGSLTPAALGQTLFSDDPTLALSSMQTRTFSVQATDLGQPMKFTLVWTDPASPVGVGGLQNQLSLQLAPPGGAPVIDADSTPFPNPTNNVQRIVVAAPVAGTYEVRVRSANVVSRSAGAGAPAGLVQDFAIAASNVMGLSTTPVTIATAIDTTGSMDFFAFMEPAKERAAQLVDFMRGGDRFAVSEFSRRGAPPDGRTPYPVRTLTSFSPDWTDAHMAIAGLHADGMTPIGAGLLAAWTELSGEAAGRPAGIVLLSDGFNNTAPDPATVLPTIPASVPIFAVALGPAASTPALSAISGSRPGGAYFAVEADEDVHHLHEIYASLQALAAAGALLGLDTADVAVEAPVTTDVAVEPGLDSVTFTTSWTGAAKLLITVTDPAGVARDASIAGTAVVDGASYRHVRVAAPPPGVWQIDVSSRAKAVTRVTTSASAPSVLVLTAETRQRTRGRTTVIARLLNGAAAVDDAKVTARIELPTLDLAAVLEKHRRELAKLRLPKSLREPGLSAAQQQLVALAALGTKYRGQSGGLFGRQVVEVDLVPVGGGRYTGDIATPVAGVIRVDVRAAGDLAGFPYQRRAQRSLFVSQKPRRLRPVR